MHALTKILRTKAKLFIGRSVWKSYSQSGEDAVVRALLGDVKHGIYVDIGAYDPVLYSNTYHFYRAGWRGVVIDPNRSLAPLYRVIRPRDTFVNAAVGRPGELVYNHFPDGAYNSLDPAQIDVLRARGMHPTGQYTVQVRPLTTIVTDAGLSRIDLMSVDVEGMDAEVLSSYDWRVRPHVVVAEDTTFDPALPSTSRVYSLMAARGYRMAGYAGVSIIFRDSAR